MLGYNDTLDSPPEVYENFEKSLNRFSKLHKGPILIAHSDINVTGKAIDIAKKTLMEYWVHIQIQDTMKNHIGNLQIILLLMIFQNMQNPG